MNKISNKLLLTADKFMPDFHLKQPGFTYRACGPFTKHCERIKKFREMDKACFSHDAACSDSKDLAKRTMSDNISDKTEP